MFHIEVVNFVYTFSQVVYVSHHVVFNKNIYPFAQLSTYTSLSPTTSTFTLLIPSIVPLVPTTCLLFIHFFNYFTICIHWAFFWTPMPTSNSSNLSNTHVSCSTLPSFVSSTSPPQVNCHLMVTRAKVGIKKPKIYIDKIGILSDPKSWQYALKISK